MIRQAVIIWTLLTSAAIAKPTLLPFKSEHCGPCRHFAREYEAIPAFKAWLQRNFKTAIAVDVNQQPDVARQYNITVVPTFVVLDPDGREIARIVGYHGSTALARQLSEILSACPRPQARRQPAQPAQPQPRQPPNERIIPNDINREIIEANTALQQRIGELSDALQLAESELQAERRRNAGRPDNQQPTEAQRAERIRLQMQIDALKAAKVRAEAEAAELRERLDQALVDLFHQVEPDPQSEPQPEPSPAQAADPAPTPHTDTSPPQAAPTEQDADCCDPEPPEARPPDHPHAGRGTRHGDASDGAGSQPTDRTETDQAETDRNRAERIAILARWAKVGLTIAAPEVALPSGAALTAAGLGISWLRRRRRQQSGTATRTTATTAPQHTERTIVVDKPPATARERIETQFVEIETDKYQRAHEQARQQVARRYPGCQEVLEAELNLTRQYLAGQP